MALHVADLIGAGLREAAEMFWDTLWALVLGFALSGFIQAFVPRSTVRRWLGNAGPLALLRATGFGAASSSCSYAAAAMAKSMFADGADFLAAMVFMFASTNLVIELGIVLVVLIGWQFAVGEAFGGLLMIVLLALLGRITLGRPLVAAARRRLEQHSQPTALATSAPSEQGWTARLRQGSLWTAAGGYGLADLRMLRKEIAGGFLVAGFLAALVPEVAWRALFLTGHGLGSDLENAAIGPLIAMLSFVCSVGNVPLAAAFWKGGISFGGVASFIYADLITLPLLLIYRKFYGTRLTLRLWLTFWAVMSAAGLATQFLFSWLGAVPQIRPSQIALDAFGLNPTTVLDLAAILALVLGWLWLRHRPLASTALANDPVCGMQVERVGAPARVNFGNQTFYFCSDRCRDRFDRDPGRFAAVGSVPVEATRERRETDPVCGMEVASGPGVAHWQHRGTTYWFCSSACRDRFSRDPASYLPGEDPPAETETDPVCGMAVDPERAGARSEFRGRTRYFCSGDCRDRFLEHPDGFSAMTTIAVADDLPRLPIDPICGMEVNPAHPGARLDLAGETVYFCCRACADEYQAARPGQV